MNSCCDAQHKQLRHQKRFLMDEVAVTIHPKEQRLYHRPSPLLAPRVSTLHKAIDSSLLDRLSEEQRQRDQPKRISGRNPSDEATEDVGLIEKA